MTSVWPHIRISKYLIPSHVSYWKDSSNNCSAVTNQHSSTLGIYVWMFVYMKRKCSNCARACDSESCKRTAVLCCILLYVNASSSASMKNSIRGLWLSPARAFWESSVTLKFSIIGRISPSPVHSESAAAAAAMSRHHSKTCRAQHEQHRLLIFLAHTARKKNFGLTVSCKLPPPSPLQCSQPYLMSLWRKMNLEENKRGTFVVSLKLEENY